jgi:hypothetical protein
MKPAVLWIFQFAFGCHHSQMSRVFTIEKRTYQVCFKCGQEFDYSWSSMHPGRPALPLARMRH